MTSPDGTAPGMHHVVDDLREQLARYQTLPAQERDAFTFSITRDEAREAIDAFHRTSCAAERTLAHGVADLFAPGLEKILVTIGACPTLGNYLPTHSHIRRSHVIGQEIPSEVYEDLLNTPDQRLSDAFQPQCPYCPHERGVPAAHPAVLSYLRHLPSELVAVRMRLDDHDGNIQGMEYRIAQKRLVRHDADAEVVGLQQCIEDEALAREKTEQVFSQIAASTTLPFVQVKTRVKGVGRLAQKIVRMALNIGGAGQIRDQYGIQCVVRTDELAQTKVFAHAIADALDDRRKGSVIEPVRYDASPNGAWNGYKMLAAYGEDGLVIPVAFQFLPLNAYWRERVDHPFYEERQRRELDDLRVQDIPVDKMLAAVEAELSRAAADWRAAHSSS